MGNQLRVYQLRYKTLKDYKNLKRIEYNNRDEITLIEPYYDKDEKGIMIPLVAANFIFKVNIPREVIMECIRDCDETEENKRDK